MYAPPEEHHPEQRTFSMALYMISTFAAILQYFNSIPVILLGAMLVTLCFFMAKAQGVTARETIYSTHVEWTRRTLSIGSFFLFPISLIAAFYFIYTTTDINALKNSLDASTEGDLGDTIILVKNYVAANMEKVEKITSISLAPPILWWVRRCIYGFMKAQKSEPIDYPEGFL